MSFEHAVVVVEGTAGLVGVDTGACLGRETEGDAVDELQPAAKTTSALMVMEGIRFACGRLEIVLRVRAI